MSLFYNLEHLISSPSLGADPLTCQASTRGECFVLAGPLGSPDDGHEELTISSHGSHLHYSRGNQSG